ncbi:hypothetical protein [Hymenobacter fodinae]|uniref:hypothetical protein n=1 Tax=Hymenobacter fodinae TaxID=2510796 RepID=UPI001AEBCE67|nr:hypothetical protein [Hymenobacter fodinae]
MLRRHYAEGKYQGSGRGLILLVLAVLLALGGLVVWGVWELGTTIWHYFAQHPWQ